MRKSTYAAIMEAVAVALDPIVGRIVQGTDLGANQRHEAIMTAVEAVQPASVELDQELADRIVEKIHGPLTIPQHFSDWIREQAKYSEIMRVDPLGYGPHCGTSQYVLKSVLGVPRPQRSDALAGHVRASRLQQGDVKWLDD